MLENQRVFARDIDNSVAAATGLPVVFVRQVIKNLKTRGLVASGRPVAPPVTPQAIARILLGSADQLSSRAPDLAVDLGRLPLVSGVGEPSAEAEIVGLVEEAAGWTESKVDFRHGHIALSPTADLVDVHVRVFDGDDIRSVYRSGMSFDTAHRFLTIPMSALARIARDLLPIKATN